MQTTRYTWTPYMFCVEDHDTIQDMARELDYRHVVPAAPEHVLGPAPHKQCQVDYDFVATLAASMRERGWDGPPVLVTDMGDGKPLLIDGRHRLLAAVWTGIPVQMIEITYEEYDAQLEEVGADIYLISERVLRAEQEASDGQV